jgi:hypothetical protein
MGHSCDSFFGIPAHTFYKTGPSMSKTILRCPPISFPKDFFWGNGTSANRGRPERGRQRPVDLGHVRTLGNIKNNDTDDVAKRPLPLLQGSRRTHVVDRRERLPVLHRPAAYLPGSNPNQTRPLEPTNSSLGIISYCLCVYFIGVARKQTSKRLAVNLPLKNCPPFDFCPQHRLSKSLTEKSDFKDNCPESTYR